MYIFYLHLEETATTTDLKSNYKEIDYIKRQKKTQFSGSLIITGTNSPLFEWYIYFILIYNTSYCNEGRLHVMVNISTQLWLLKSNLYWFFFFVVVDVWYVCTIHGVK